MNCIDVSYRGISAFLKEEELISFLNRVLMEAGIENWELSLLFCNNDFIRELNQGYRAKDCPTDVLSFSQQDGPFLTKTELVCAGDIVISREFLQQEKEEGIIQDLNEELKRLLIHGVLHLLGHDHKENLSDNQETTGSGMLSLQEKILNQYKEVILF